MARIASEEKAGYYPTPPEEVELICSRLRPAPGAEGELNLLDPCCGEGEALRAMAGALKSRGAKVTSFGIELEKGRAEKARQVLDRVLHSPYEDAVVTPGVFSFLWLNPPYTEVDGQRAEMVFLRDLSDRLVPGGLLGYCVPESVLLNIRLLTLINAKFNPAAVYRFTVKNYSFYGQVVLFAYRRKKSLPPKELSAAVSALYAVLVSGKIPYLNTRDNRVFLVPPGGEVKSFYSTYLPPEEIRRLVKGSLVWEKAGEILPRPRGLLMKPPALPLKPAHMAVAIAAGAVGGNMGTHLLSGISKKVVHVEEIPDEDGVTRVTREEVKTAIRVFSPEGVFDLQ
jgi:hypothetical protein